MGIEDASHYPERNADRKTSKGKNVFRPETAQAISKALHSSGRLTDEQFERLTTLTTAGEVDEAIEALTTILEEKKSQTE